MSQTLNLQQQRWVARSTNEDIINKVHSGVLSLEALENFARTNVAFAPRFTVIRDTMRLMPDPREESDYKKALEAYTSDPTSETTIAILETYINTWRATESAAGHVDEIENLLALSNERKDFAELSVLAEQAIENYRASGTLPKRDVTAMVAQYVKQWQDVQGVDPAHIEKMSCWNDEFIQMNAERASNAWKGILNSDGSLISYDALLQFMNNYPGNQYGVEADNLLWEWALKQPDIDSAVEKYTQYTRGCGLHSRDVENLRIAKNEWREIENFVADRNSLNPHTEYAIKIINFLKSHPGHVFTAHALGVLEEEKPGVLNEISRDPIKFYRNRFMELMDSGYFDKEELVQAANANEYLLGRIRNYNEINFRLSELNLEGIMADMLHGYGKEGITDVLFFGISASGKTCILSGLLNNPDLSFDTVNYSCKYAEALQSYAIEGFAPPPTTDVTVAVVKAQTSRGKNKYHFNLVDMAGEGFVNKIADNPNSAVDFQDMGEGAPEVLRNGNDKVIFIVVDPSATGKGATKQRNVLRRLVDLFFTVKSNASITERVQGIHFIVSKSDTLEEPRLQNAREVVRGLFNNQDCSDFVENCKKFGINASAEDNLDGVPRVFCFSLGQFTVGNCYDYHRKDSDIIIQTICDYASGTRSTGIGYKIRSLLTDSLI